jgi:hypothetical protein
MSIVNRKQVHSQHTGKTFDAAKYLTSILTQAFLYPRIKALTLFFCYLSRLGNAIKQTRHDAGYDHDRSNCYRLRMGVTTSEFDRSHPAVVLTPLV